MKRWGVGSLLLTVAISLAGWGIVAVSCMMIGSRAVGWPTNHDTLVYRREVVLLASLVGAALASAGVAYQAILRNPLADPYLLGVSSGAALFAYMWRLPVFATLTAAIALREQAISQQGFAFLGAMLSVTIALAISNRRGRLEPVTLLLVGVIVNAINASIYLLIDALVGQLPGTGGPLTFLVGGLQTSLEPSQRSAAACVFAGGFVILLAISGSLNAAAVSDAEAEALGVRIQRLRWTALLVASIVTASAVAISGPIGFIGLICPHLARLFSGADQRRILPIATALGAALLASADAASRHLASHGLSLLPVGVLTSLLGGPFFLLLLLQSRRRAEVSEGRR